MPWQRPPLVVNLRRRRLVLLQAVQLSCRQDAMHTGCHADKMPPRLTLIAPCPWPW